MHSYSTQFVQVFLGTFSVISQLMNFCKFEFTFISLANNNTEKITKVLEAKFDSFIFIQYLRYNDFSEKLELCFWPMLILYRKQFFAAGKTTRVHFLLACVQTPLISFQRGSPPVESVHRRPNPCSETGAIPSLEVPSH